MKPVCIVLILLTGLAWSQNAPSAPPEYRNIKAFRLSTLQNDLNEVARQGYRLSRGKTGNTTNPVVYWGLGTEGGMIARMERTQNKYEYAVVLKPVKASNWERDINLRAAEGFRVVPRFTIPVNRTVFPFPTLDELITIMERGPNQKQARYFAVQTHSVDGFASAVQKKLDLGASVMWMGKWGEWQVALLESDSGDAERVMLSGSSKKVFGEIERRGHGGARLSYYLDGLGLTGNGAAAYLVKTAASVEYKMLPNKKRSREPFNEAVKSGFKVASGLCAEQSLILLRNEGEEPVTYVFEESPDEVTKLNASGHTLVCYGALLGYRDVAILQKP